jgi:DNA-binding IclR family transcriptional regulator
MGKESHRYEIETKIIKFCATEFRSLGEIAEKLDMNKNTLRSRYLYPMTKEGKLKRSLQSPFKSHTKYKSGR